jgi:hypothetical protein
MITEKTALKRESFLHSNKLLDKITNKFIERSQQFIRALLEAPPQFFYDPTIPGKNPRLSLIAKFGRLAEPLVLLDLLSSLSPSGNQSSMMMAWALSTLVQKPWTKRW